MAIVPPQIKVDARSTQTVSITGDDVAALLTADGRRIAEHEGVSVTSVNLVPFYLCPDECEPAPDQPSVRLDLTVDVSGSHLSQPHPGSQAS
ncbi:hypothetical protein AB0N20_02755 [Streptomyces griseoincarnatus]